MKDEAINNREKLGEIRRSMLRGEISYEQAKELAAPVLNRINKRGQEIAKKYNMKPGKITFTEIMR